MSRDVSTPLTSMHLAITMPDAAPSLLPERSRMSTGSVPFSCLIGSAKPLRLSDVSSALTEVIVYLLISEPRFLSHSLHARTG
jgi:hypothetical protein